MPASFAQIMNLNSYKATPEAGYSFTGWSGDAGGSDATTTVTMTSNRSVTANFHASIGGLPLPGLKIMQPLLQGFACTKAP